MKRGVKRSRKDKIALLIPWLVVITLFGVLVIINFDNSKLTGFVAGPIESEEFLQGELIIKYKENVIGNGNEIFNKEKNEILVYEYLEKPNEIEKIIDNKELYVLRFNDADINEVDIINSYKNIPEVEYIDRNYLFETLIVPDDSRYNQQYGIKSINGEEAWNLTVGNRNVVIAIIDTGVEYAHEDLINNLWNNSDEGCDENFDLDNNSYKGDCRGYDFVDVSSGCSDNDCSNEDNNPTDAHGHGTHIAGIAGAVSNNNLGIAGICWNCSIMPIRAGYKDDRGNGVLTLSEVVQALHYASDNNATIISMSFGGSHSVTLEEAINYSYKSILVASAGNSGSSSIQYPCGYENVICIASTNPNNQSSGFSNYGEWVDLAAPGSSILSTYLNDSYKSLSGTSMSTPMVAGSIGLIKSLFDLNQSEIKNVLNNTGTTVDFNGVGITMINVYSSILSLDNIKPNVTLIYPENNSVNLTLNQTFSCEADDWNLKNLTLIIWNSTESLFYSETKNISGVYNKSSFNVFLNEDSYKWSCLVYDYESNYGSADNSLSAVKTSTSLIYPLNNTQTNQKDISFNCSARTDTTKNIKNITFYLWNSSDLIHTNYKEVSGVYNELVSNYNFSYEENYLWGCSAFTDNSADNFTELITTGNFILIYDITQPIINLLEPENEKNYILNNSNQEIDFSFNINEKNDVNNCNLIVNNEIKSTNNSVDKSLTQNLKSSFVDGNYNWKIICNDKAGNVASSEERGFKILSAEEDKKSEEGGEKSGEGEEGGEDESEVQVPASAAGSRGGGDGGGVGESSLPKKTYFISDEQFLEGYTNELKQSDEIKFYFQDEKIFDHSLIINDIGGDYADITIKSNPINLKLAIGEEKRINLTSPNYFDLFIKLNSINSNKANINIQRINESIESENQKGITGFAVDEDKGNETNIGKIVGKITGFVTSPIKSISGKASTLFYLIIAIIIVFIIIVLLFRRRQNKIQNNLIKK